MQDLLLDEQVFVSQTLFQEALPRLIDGIQSEIVSQPTGLFVRSEVIVLHQLAAHAMAVLSIGQDPMPVSILVVVVEIAPAPSLTAEESLSVSPLVFHVHLMDATLLGLFDQPLVIGATTQPPLVDDVTLELQFLLADLPVALVHADHHHLVTLVPPDLHVHVEWPNGHRAVMFGLRLDVSVNEHLPLFAVRRGTVLTEVVPGGGTGLVQGNVGNLHVHLEELIGFVDHRLHQRQEIGEVFAFVRRRDRGEDLVDVREEVRRFFSARQRPTVQQRVNANRRLTAVEKIRMGEQIEKDVQARQRGLRPVFIVRDESRHALIPGDVLFEDQHRVQEGNGAVDEVVRQSFVPGLAVRGLREEVVDELDQFARVALVGRSGFPWKQIARH